MRPLPPRYRLSLAVLAVAVLAMAAFGFVRWGGGVGGRPARWSAVGTAGPGGAGGGTAAVAPDGAATCAGRPVQTTRELRGMWITTVNNTDWPSRPGLDRKTVEAEYRGWLDLAQQRNLNAVFVHIRPSGDAFWPSRFDPWSEF